MRLLPKKDAGIETQKQKKLLIDEGVSLATRVDTLRETLSSEEARLQQFRTHATQDVTREIDLLLVRKNQLTKECDLLAKERIKLLMPVDLTEEWDKVHILEREVALWRKDLSDRETSLIEKESSVLLKETGFTKREKDISEVETYTNRLVEEAQEKYRVAEKDYVAAQLLKEERTKELKVSRNEIRAAKAALDEREALLVKEAEENATERAAIEKEQVHIAAQQTSLKNAWEQLKKIKGTK